MSEKPNILNKKKELTAKDVAEIICDAIEDERSFKRPVIMPVIESLIKAFTIANNQIVVERNQTARLRGANLANFRSTYWQRRCRMIDPENIENYYRELEALEEKMDFANSLSHLAIPEGYNFEKAIKLKQS